MITTCPGVRLGIKHDWSQVSNTVRLHAPSTVNGANKRWLHKAAIILTLPLRCPYFKS